MAFWLHLVPKLHRRDSFKPVFHALEVNWTEGRAVRDDATMTQVSMETASTTSPIFPWSAENGSVWMSSRPGELETSDDGLPMDSTSVSAAGVGSRLLMATLAVGGTLLLINCVVFAATLCHQSQRIKKLATTKPAQPITYVKLHCCRSSCRKRRKQRKQNYEFAMNIKSANNENMGRV